MWHDVLFSARHSRTERKRSEESRAESGARAESKGRKNSALVQNRFFASLGMTNKVGAYDGQLIKCGLYRSPKSSTRTMISRKVFVFLSAVCPRRTLSSPINVGKQQPRRYTRYQLCGLSAFPALLELLCLLDLLESLAYTNLAVIPETKSP